MSFSSDVQRLTDQYRKRLSYVAKTATQSVIHEAQRTKAQGGRLPLDTGFLRSSLAASTRGVPSGPTSGDGPINAEPFTAELIRWRPGETQLWAGWTAQYARVQEYRNGFLRGATERWQEYVNKAAAEAKRKRL